LAKDLEVTAKYQQSFPPFLTTFEPKQSKQRTCNAKAQKGVDQELELEVEK